MTLGCALVFPRHEVLTPEEAPQQRLKSERSERPIKDSISDPALVETLTLMR